ncbi:hypothetical protein [[Eubacterium] cellulosolvens]
MSKTYTANQTGAIACLTAGLMWGVTVHGVGWMLNQTTWVYSIIITIGWILLPLYVKLVRQAFIVGIFISVLAMCYLPVTPILLGTAPWFTFSRGIVDLTYVMYYIIALLGIYFAYRSWRELQPK